MADVAGRQVAFRIRVVAEPEQVRVVWLGARVLEQPIETENPPKSVAPFGSRALKLNPNAV